MQDGLFFRVLRRFNMVLCTLIALVLLAGAGIVGWSAVKEGRLGLFSFKSEPVPAVTKSSVKYEVALAPYGSKVTDTTTAGYDIFVLNRTAWPEGAEFYPGPDVVNVMDIDPETGSGQWAFKGTARTIIMRDPVRKGDASGGSATGPHSVVALVMWVHDGDIGKDGFFTDKDGISVYVWRLGKTPAVKLLRAEDGISTGQSSATRYNIVYKKGKQTISAVYSVPDFKLVSENVLPEVSQ
jgi:hypothetical protein